MDEEIILSLEAGLTKNIIVYVEAGLMGIMFSNRRWISVGLSYPVT